MLSFYVLIGLYKVPELLLALLCHELTGEGEYESGGLISWKCIVLATANSTTPKALNYSQSSSRTYQ